MIYDSAPFYSDYLKAYTAVGENRGSSTRWSLNIGNVCRMIFICFASFPIKRLKTPLLI